MDRIWEFYENMNEIVYVSDMDTHDIIYMNKKTRNIYGVNSIEDVKGRKCHEIFQGCLQPCAICTNKELTEGKFKEWEYYNPFFRKKFLLKDTLIPYKGRRYRLEIAIDISSQEQAISDYISNETIINEAIRLALFNTDPGKALDILLEYLGKSLKCERTYIFEQRKDSNFDNTYEWCASGVEPQKDNLQDFPYEAAKIWLDIFDKDENVIIRNLEDTKETDPLMYEFLLPQDITSLVVSPLKYNDKVIGFFGVDNPPPELMGHISTLFQIMGNFLVSLIRRRNMFVRLEKMSFVDQLTGLGNRYSMEKVISELDNSKSMGIVFCDVTGLKKINDTEGHSAGDKLIIRSAECIEKVFDDYYQFRIGGDEFVVLCPLISEDDFNGLVDMLKKEVKECSIVLAIGQVWHSSVDNSNINELLVDADALMYENKRKYYESIGEKMR
jgi:diguanylate cyclase (GGDEF)-like protein